MWIVEAVPAWTTSLLIIVIMLLTVSDSAIAPLISGYDKSDLVSYKTIMYTFANPTVMLFMGGFILALVASKSGVDVSIARAMLKPFGSRPYVVLFGFMLVTAIFSMFVSNTATAAMMLTNIEKIAVTSMKPKSTTLGLEPNGLSITRAMLTSTPLFEATSARMNPPRKSITVGLANVFMSVM